MVSIPVNLIIINLHRHFNNIEWKFGFQRNTSSRSIDLNGQDSACKISPEYPIKHPLQDQWTLWYLEHARNKSWEEMLNKVTSFGTVEDFWSLNSHIVVPSELGEGNDYSLFKGNIRPMWEDKANKYGGRWILNFNRAQRRSDLDDMWLDTVSFVDRLKTTLQHNP